MTTTQSYIDPNGIIIIDGKPVEFVKRQQNLRARPSRTEEVNDHALKLSFICAVASMLVVMAAFTAMAWILSIII